MSTEITKEQIESEKENASRTIEYAMYGRSKDVVVASELFPPLFYYRNDKWELILGIVPDDHPAKLRDKPPVAFNYYFSEYGGIEVRTWDACELPEDEDEWESFTESELLKHYGNAEKIRYVWPYNEVPDMPAKPTIATGPEPMPTWLDPEDVYQSPSPYIQQKGVSDD